MKEGSRSSVNGVCVDGKGELGRKRKRVNGPNEKDEDDGDGVVSNGVNTKTDSGSNSGDDSGLIENLASSSPEIKVKEEISGCETLGCGDNGTNTNVDGNASGDTGQVNTVASKGKRGRKRKNSVVSGLVEGDGQKLEKVVLDAMTQVNGRVLRSRTMVSANGGGNDASKENVVGKTEVGIEQIDKKKIKVERDKDEIVQSSRRGRKKKKGRRGRPPKINSEKGASGMVSANGGGNDVSKENVVGKTEVGIEQVDKKKIKVERDEDEIVQSSRRGRKKKKGRRGRPPKINSEKGASGMVVDRKDKAVKFKKKLKKKGNKMKAEAIPKNSKSSEPCKSDGTESKEERGTGRQEKQLVREKIMEMLFKAGWTIDYRPRNGREYNDAVYVDRVGRTHWSITKAYRRLKEKVDDGVADAQEIAAFAVIPDEVFSKLFKVVEKKRNDFGIKKGKRVTIKELVQNKSLGSKKADSKFKEKSNLCPKSHVGKPRSTPVEGRNKKRYALLARGSENGSNLNGDGFVLYDGKRSLLSWMIDLGTVPQSGKVQYMNPRRTRVMLEGKITGDGIRCGCCNDIHTILSFESHAGSKLSEPFKNIYLKSGPALLECLLDSWSKQEKIDKIGFCSVDVAGDDPNDDTCNICGDGGDLICCDSCPSTFHQICLDIQHFPTGDWRCVYCSCKFCGTIGGKTSQDDDNHGACLAKLFTCLLCEEKFHIPCIEGKDAVRINSKTPSFCGEGCQKLFKCLPKLLGIRHELDEGFSWTILQRQDVGRGQSLSDDPLKVECNSKLAVAFSVMDECFLPIIDQRSKSNMIHNVVYSCGSNFKRLNYSGFYTIILERGDEIVAAASIRIHGTQLAEMPFIATRYRYRRQGMCRRLLTAIETALCSLDVEKLVIPAISELMETWTKVFGFMPLEESKRREMRFMSMIVFPGTDMLQKPLQKHRLTNEQMTSAAGSECPELGIENRPRAEDQPVDELPNEYATKCFSGSDSNASAEAKIGKVDEADAAVGSGASLPDGSLNDAGWGGAELRPENEPKAEDQTVDDLPNEYAMKCSSVSDFNASAEAKLGKNYEADAAVGSAASLLDGFSNAAGPEGAEHRTENEPKAENQTVDELPDKYATKRFPGSDSDVSSEVKIGKNDEADAAVVSGASLPDGSLNTASDITNGTPKERNNMLYLDLNASVDDKDITAPEISMVDDDPSFDARQTADAMKIDQSARSGPVSLHFGEKIVKCISKLIQQNSH